MVILPDSNRYNTKKKNIVILDRILMMFGDNMYIIPLKLGCIMFPMQQKNFNNLLRNSPIFRIFIV